MSQEELRVQMREFSGTRKKSRIGNKRLDQQVWFWSILTSFLPFLYFLEIVKLWDGKGRR